MAYREVTMLEIKEVLRLWLEGKAKREIARQVKLDRNTVRSYVKAATKCGLFVGGIATDEQVGEVVVQLKSSSSELIQSDAWQCCEKQRAFIEQHLRGRVQLTKVQRLLKRRGVNVSYATLYRYAVKELGFGRDSPSIPVADCEAGAEIQLDTGWMTLLEPDGFGKCRRFRAWIFTAVLSRHRFVYPCFRETTETAIEACEAAWEYFGGIFHVIIPDNTKTIVQKADPLQPLINPVFREYAQARGFHIDPARSKSPKDKARVERSVPTIREDCFRGERLRTIEDALRRARQWALEEYGMRRHTSTLRMPREYFESAEKARLLPAPSEPYDAPILCDPKVGTDQHAQVAKALYSLPFDLRGKKLHARANRTTVRFYYKAKLVKTHPRCPPGGRSTDLNDFPPEKAAYAMRDCTFLLHQADEKGPDIARFAKALLDGPLPWTRMRRCFALLGLCRRFGDRLVNETCKMALAADMIDIRRLERMLQLGSPPCENKAIASNVIPLARYLRPASQYAIPFIRKDRKEDQAVSSIIVSETSPETSSTNTNNGEGHNHDH